MSIRSLFIYFFLVTVASSVGVEAQNPPAVPPVEVEAESLLDIPLTAIEGETEKSFSDQNTMIEKPDVIIDSEAKPDPLNAISTDVPAPPEKPIPEIGNDLTVLELFSTQACTFCPKADTLMKQLITKENLIALSCHIDYFDVDGGSLSQPICSTRQIAYEGSLDSGPKYTPQMVVNGRYDAIGYLASELDDAFLRAQTEKIHALEVEKRNDGLFDLILPDLDVRKYKIWLLAFDNPRTIIVADGANRGKEMTYYNVVSKAGFLGNWKGVAKIMKFDAKLEPVSKGFAILVHDEENNHIVAAVKYLK